MLIYRVATLEHSSAQNPAEVKSWQLLADRSGHFLYYLQSMEILEVNEKKTFPQVNCIRSTPHKFTLLLIDRVSDDVGHGSIAVMSQVQR